MHRKTPIDSENELIKEFDYMSQSKIAQPIETRDIQEINQVPVSPRIVRIIRTKEMPSLPSTDSPKHTHYHSEYDLSKPPKNPKNKKYHRRFHYRQVILFCPDKIGISCKKISKILDKYIK
jgi:hypothetical protein